MALDQSQFYTDPATGTQYTSYASFQQNTQGVALPGNVNPNTGQIAPPNTSAAVPSSQLSNGALNLPVGATPDNGAGLVAGAVTGTADPLSGDYSTDPNYKAAETTLSGSETDLKKAQAQMPSGADLLKTEQDSSGATQDLATLKKLRTELASLTAEFDIASQTKETQGIERGTPAVFFQGEQAAIQRQKAVVVGAKAAQVAAAQGNYELSEALAEKTADLKFADWQNKINNIKDFINLNKDNLTRVEKLAISKMDAKAKKEQTKLDEQKENVKLALTEGVKTKIVNQNGKWYRTSDGHVYTPEELFKEFPQLKGDFNKAYTLGLVTDITGATMEDRDYVKQAQAKYMDVSIPRNATKEQVAQIIKGSKIYQKDSKITGNYELTTDAMGNTVIFNKDTGNVVNSTGTNPSNLDANTVIIKNAFNALGPRLTKDAKNSGLQVINQYLASGDTEGAKQYILSTAISALPVEQQNKAFGRLQAIDSLNDVQNALNEYTQVGGDTNILKGSFEKITQKLGQTTDPKLADVANRIALSMIAYRNAVSGAAFTESEQKQYESIFPSIKGNTELNKAKIDSILSVFNLNQKSTLTTVLGQKNYDSIMEQPTDNGIIEYNGKKYPLDKDGNFDLNKPLSSTGNSALAIANAIKKVESGGNYNAKGGSGESGAYQFMPATWSSWAKQYLGNANAPMTQANQDKVALTKIQDLLGQGYDAQQIALIWNGGTPTVKKGTNKFGVKYDSGSYAKKVLNALG